MKVYPPPPPHVSLQYTTLVYSICKPFSFVNFATYLGSPWLQCYTPWFSYNTLLSPDLQHTGVLSLLVCNTLWFNQFTIHLGFSSLPTHPGSLTLQHLGSSRLAAHWGFLLVCNTLWFNRFTIHLGFSSFATHLGSFTLQQIMVLSSAVTLQFTLFAIYFGLLSSHCWFTPYAKHSGLQYTSVPSGLQGILVHFSETRCHPAWNVSWFTQWQYAMVLASQAVHFVTIWFTQFAIQIASFICSRPKFPPI